MNKQTNSGTFSSSTSAGSKSNRQRQYQPGLSLSRPLPFSAHRSAGCLDRVVTTRTTIRGQQAALALKYSTTQKTNQQDKARSDTKQVQVTNRGDTQGTVEQNPTNPQWQTKPVGGPRTTPGCACAALGHSLPFPPSPVHGLRWLTIVLFWMLFHQALDILI